MGGYFIGMDVGGTHMRLLFESANGTAALYEGAGCSVSVVGFDATRTAYEKVVQRALRENGRDAKDCLSLCVGAAGVDSEALRLQYLRIFEELGFVRERVHIFNDSELFLHLSDEGAHVVSVAGTGAISIGRSEGGRIVRCGGWGHLLSDEGSGSYLVMRALTEIIHHLDGCESCPILADLFRQESGLANQHDIAQFYFRHVAQKGDLARYAYILDRAAESGDPTARRILKEAAECIFRSIMTVSEAVRPANGRAFDIILWGSVLIKSALIRTHVTELVQRTYRQARVNVADQEAVRVALDIAKRLYSEQSKPRLDALSQCKP